MSVFGCPAARGESFSYLQLYLLLISKNRTDLFPMSVPNLGITRASSLHARPENSRLATASPSKD